MKEPGYRRMTLRAWIGRETEQTGTGWMILSGGMTLLAFIAVRTFCGNPYRAILELGISDLIPPVWLFTLLQALAFFTAGCAAGFVLGYRTPGCAAEKYRGCMLFVLAAAVELAWYPVFFSSMMVLAAVLVALLAFLLAILTTVSFFRVSRFSGILFVLHDIWAFSVLALSVRTLLRS